MLPPFDDPPAAEPIGWLHSTILGIVEGLTEFLPISSTGHLIATKEMLQLEAGAYEVAIQAGAITAIVLLYWGRLWNAVRSALRRQADVAGQTNLLLLIVVAALPAAIVGILFEEQIERLLFNTRTVAIALIVGGIGFLAVERWVDARRDAGRSGDTDVDAMSVRQALVIGVWQCLALIPGASRSGSTIVGGLFAGCHRAAAAEFSFLVGLPILYGACLLKLVENPEIVSGPMLSDFLIGSIVSFVSAAAVVAWFVRFLRRRTFRPFAWYRIAAGTALLIWFA